MGTDWLSFAYGTASLVLSGAILFLLQLRASRQDEVRKKLETDLARLNAGHEQHAREIRDTRSAIARIEGHLKLEPFRYSSD
jgi:hypothetical protein